MTSSSLPSRRFQIPIIDITQYLLSPTSPSFQDLIDQVRGACLSTGFFQLTGHGIPRDLRERVFEGSKMLFELSMEEKGRMRKELSVGASNRGYEVLAGQGLEEGMRADLKEGFYIGKETPATDPRVQSNAFLIGPNVWPPTSLLPAALFRHPMEEYYTQIHTLSLTVLELIAKGLPYGDDIFSEFVDDAVANIRLLHYPPDESGDEKQLGAGAHTDFGAVTLLLQDDVGGLQVWDEGEGGGWRDVPPNKDAYVVNIGDMLQMWTNNEYKSSLHRVLNHSGKDRYSVPFFFDGNINCALKPLDGSAARGGKPLTVEEHMKERFASTYGRGKTEVNKGVLVSE